MNTTTYRSLLSRLSTKAPRTAVQYRRIIERFAAFLKSTPTTGTPDYKIQAFLLAQCLHQSAASVNQAIAALAWFYRQQEIRIDVHRLRAKTGRRLPVVIGIEELTLHIAALPMPHRLLALLFAGSGLTMAQALALTEDFDGGEKPLAAEAVKLLDVQRRTNARLRQEKGIESPRLLFPSKRDPTCPIAPNAFRKATRAAGLPLDFTPSHLRATFIVEIIRRYGMPTAKDLTGLSAHQIAHYARMIPPWVKSPLDAL